MTRHLILGLVTAATAEPGARPSKTANADSLQKFLLSIFIVFTTKLQVMTQRDKKICFDCNKISNFTS